VTPVKLYLFDERPATLPASAQVSGLPCSLAAVADAHVPHVGRSTVRRVLPEVAGSAVRVWQIQMQAQWTQLEGINGFVAKDGVTAQKPVGGVPPRGRPV
jgi:hypothetical protein